jgi:hypothetical protein
MGQFFYADPKHTFIWPNGAVGHRPCALPFDDLGPYAKVRNCPVDGTELRLTCYATGYPDTYWSIPACTRYKGKYVKGFFVTRHSDNRIDVAANEIVFCVVDRDREKVGLPARRPAK